MKKHGEVISARFLKGHRLHIKKGNMHTDNNCLKEVCGRTVSGNSVFSSWIVTKSKYRFLCDAHPCLSYCLVFPFFFKK